MLKIAVTGPESTGKSELCKALAKHYNSMYVPEFARTFLEGRQAPYTSTDLDKIAEGQTLSEKSVENNGHDIIFYDTEMTVMKIWSEHALGFCTDIISHLYNKQYFDLYLLTNIDLPWEPDPLRENPDLREHFLLLYKNELMQKNRNFKIISGLGIVRTQNAIQEIEDFRQRALIL